MSSPIRGGLGRRLAMLTAATALTIGLGAATALAAEVDVEPSSGLSATGSTTVAVTGSGFTASEEFRVGLCSAESYGVFGIPACGAMEDVTADGSGGISTSLGVEKVNANVHAGITFPFNVGQPAEFTCAGTDPEEDDCEIVVATHGGTTEILASEAVSFLDFP